ncbi:hypothetical protein LEP1GSC132_4001 [Leptospira kirschneri str. 200803703]|uniref:Uncharacterized protein n=1 Tax=Leptospira kirschneri str. 200802841 TaxID=1193047 RepID=A0A828XVF1_9LEPT|nr:hypothetical protein LEP1GSC131_1877 [Leptospira kirschneri str. 200802841]EKP05721.1 hypothetical protein LEP1GSC018_0976 [Leptospira kirschneri str. 2008720114]EMJ89927.1 hypothetical protein LEP1GSC198_3535 [Leptospira kirschneri str. JB]EMK07408.1 hypothetical protein LEP1GSC176_0888 [Leptospira kirschneri str. MMD1493]EMO66698.1 hypothetical protein LEP1GSC132_4001 [Leptospira kirschneri str. 200803703]EMO77310.1 hypothetical protein LEP1GSC127_3136 [Leptospira kirschneri str. 20080192
MLFIAFDTSVLYEVSYNEANEKQFQEPVIAKMNIDRKKTFNID